MAGRKQVRPPEPGWVWQVEEDESSRVPGLSGHRFLDKQNHGLEREAGCQLRALIIPFPSACLGRSVGVGNAVSPPGLACSPGGSQMTIHKHHLSHELYFHPCPCPPQVCAGPRGP